jgi:hypothetical protein
LQELQAELDAAMGTAGGEVEARVSLHDRQINVYAEARAAIKSVLALGQGERGPGSFCPAYHRHAQGGCLLLLLWCCIDRRKGKALPFWNLASVAG